MGSKSLVLDIVTSQLLGIMKLLILLFLSFLLALTDSAPLIFAAKIIKSSTLFRGIYGLLGIQPENFFTTESSIFQ